MEQALDLVNHVFSNYFTNNTFPPYIDAISQTDADRASGRTKKAEIKL